MLFDVEFTKVFVGGIFDGIEYPTKVNNVSKEYVKFLFSVKPDRLVKDLTLNAFYVKDITVKRQLKVA